jgi:hypothetical protein
MYWIDRGSLMTFLREVRDVKTEVSARGDADFSKASRISSSSEEQKPKGELDPAVEAHMRMAARMLYDIIAEWRERHHK